MRFFNITAESELDTNKLLKTACIERNVEYIELFSDNFDLTSAMEILPGDMLYRTYGGEPSRVLEWTLAAPELTTMFAQWDGSLRLAKRQMTFEKNGLPVPRTIYSLTSNRKHLESYVEYMGGFPIVLKDTTGSHGVGVIKVDSIESLVSMADYLLKKNHKFVIQQFIKVTSTARLIVLNDRVIDSIEYRAPENDFRSNVGAEPEVHPMKFSDEIEAIAVKAAQSVDIEFGGVDVIVDEEGKPYILELNFPCFFPRSQNTTGVDIAGMMIDHLIEKTKKV